jgi:hypothetical protein
VGSDLSEIDRWRGRIEAGALVGPSIIRAGPILNGREFNRYQLAITNAGDAKATVRALQKAGDDLIKVHRQTGRGAYFADRGGEASWPPVSTRIRSTTFGTRSGSAPSSCEGAPSIEKRSMRCSPNPRR